MYNIPLDTRITSKGPDINVYVGQVSLDVNNGDMVMWNGVQWVPFSQRNKLDIRKREILNEFEENPELLNEVMVELRRKKIEKLKK